ncbi:homoserine kinase [Lacticaseibacillus daqingensis]|uniref:hypothetical protein n=1 Tax=Lacticaseibacillus daqingensis TaxID=2486014 RepID=UPI000F796E11|nr:hypothetical protein [Lacticaseibacillus daqingensis]
MKIWVPGVITSKLAPTLAVPIDWGLELAIERESLDWHIDCADPALATDQSNLIITIAQSLAPDLVPHQLRLTQTLPIGQGLGSSLAATVAGVTLVEALTHTRMGQATKAAEIAVYEPAPAAIAAVLTGTSAAGAAMADAGLQAVLYLPTQPPAAAVPAQPSAPVAAKALLAALTRRDRTWLQRHFPLSAQVSPTYFPHAEMVSRAVLAAGGLTCLVSGNGPALLCLAPADHLSFVTELSATLQAGRLVPVGAAPSGTRIYA